MLIAIIILSNVTQGTGIIGHESQFYGQFAEQASFSWDVSGFGVNMLFLPAECQFTSTQLVCITRTSSRHMLEEVRGGMLRVVPLGKGIVQLFSSLTS